MKAYRIPASVMYASTADSFASPWRYRVKVLRHRATGPKKSKAPKPAPLTLIRSRPDASGFRLLPAGLRAGRKEARSPSPQ